MEDVEIGELLVQRGLITREQFDKALEVLSSTGGRLSVILIKLGFITEQAILDFFAQIQSLPAISNLDELILPEVLIRKMPREIIERFGVLPIMYRDGVLTIAMFDPFDLQAIDEVALAMDSKVAVNLASRSQIQKCVQELFYKTRAMTKEDMVKELDVEPRSSEKRKKKDVTGLTADATARILVALLEEKKVITEDEMTRKAKQLGYLK